MQEAVKAEELGVIDYDLTLDYDYWTYCTYFKTTRFLGTISRISDDIITSVLPEDAQEEIPVGFTIVGHVGMKSLPEEEQALTRCSSAFKPQKGLPTI